MLALPLLTLLPVQFDLTLRPIADPLAATVHVIVADLDGDGDDDLIPLSSPDGEIRVIEQLAPLQFRTHLDVIGPEPGLLWGGAADVNGDGRLDLVFVTSTEVVTCFQGVGITGVWTRSSLAMTGLAPPFAIRGHDLDGDGRDEVVLRFADEVGVLDGVTTAGLDTYQFLQNGPSETVSVVDVNGDGWDDVVTLTTGPVVGWHENDGAGGFHRSSRTHNRNAATLADADGDGFVDLIAARRQSAFGNPSAVRMEIARGVGGGAFVAAFVPTATYINSICSTQLITGLNLEARGDEDGDGSQDLALYATCGPVIFAESDLLLGNGAGNWTARTNDREFGPLRVAELDGDGRPDLVEANGEVIVRPTTSPGPIGPLFFGSVFGVASPIVRSPRPTVGDVNLDGWPDVVVVGSFGGIRVEHGGPPGAPRLTSVSLGEPLERVRLGDIDGDGVLDAIQGQSTAGFQWRRGLGDGLFGPRNLVGETPWVANDDDPLRLADLDGDGDLDVLLGEAISATSSVTLRTWFNAGDGTFVAGPVTSLAQFATIEVGDVDDDGLPDLVVEMGDRIQVRPGNGTGAFVLTLFEFVLGSQPQEHVVGDIDGDGDLDIAALEASRVSWMENTGAPAGLQQRPATDLEPNASGAGLVFADLDGDGDLDAVVRHRPGSPGAPTKHTTLSFEGGAFVLGGQIDAGGYVAKIGVGDLDEDGDDDLVARPYGRLVLIENGSDPIDFVGQRYCSPAIGNSTGLPARLRAIGSDELALNDLTLSADRLPAGSFGYFLASLDPGNTFPVNDSQGRLCLGGSIGRYVGPGQIQSSGSIGLVQLTVDLDALPQPTGPVQAAVGETWHFQLWYRDANPAVTSNFTDGLAVTLR